MTTDPRTRLTRLSAAAAALAALAFVGRLVVAAGTVTLYVDDGSTCTTGCGTQGAPFRTITAAIADADARIVAGSASGATIQVAAGNYPERIYILPNIHVLCDSPATTTINAAGTGHAVVVLAGGTSGRVRTDFSIRNCRITGGVGENRTAAERISGGGVFILGNAVVSNNVISGNILAGPQPNWVGGGVYVGYGDPVIIGNVISGNVVNPPPLGGGNSDSLGIGGGIHVEGNGVGVVVTHARIEGNTISGNVAQGEVGKGGGIRVDGADGTLVTRNLIFGNRSNFGGGGIMVYGHVMVADNLVFGNSSSQFGGGLNLYHAAARVINNTIFGNSLTLASAPSGYAYANYGGAVSLDALFTQSGEALISNNLIAGNTVTTAGTVGGLHSNITSPVITYTDFWNNLKLPATVDHVGGDFVEAQVIGVNNNAALDPRFAHPPLFADVSVAAGSTTTVAVLMASRYLVNQVLEFNNDGVARTITAVNTSTNVLTFTPALPAASQAFKLLANWGSSTDTTEDFRLQPSSPMVDAGTNLPAPGVPVSPLDLDGQPRIQDGNNDSVPTIDLGAYEFMVPDSDGDGVPNGQDCAPSVNSVQTPPGTAGPTLRILTGAPVPVTWMKIPQANVFNVYRGTVGGAFAFNHLCLEAGSPDRLSPDAANPPLGTAYYYLVSGVNACGESCLGLVDPPGACEVPNPSPCVVPASDSDGDTVQNLNDNCPLVANVTQVDGDRDGVGTACDNCPVDANADQIDTNGDGVGNVCQDLDADGYKASVDCNDLDASIHPGAVEACNGIDDDCDAAVDENLGSTTCGTGACSRTVDSCVNGVPQTCTPGAPTAEVCNGIDDDCNGAIDDNLGTVTCGVGACTRTASSCVGGVPQNCTPGTPTPETCNGIDDDCDGSVDESLGSTSCGTGACFRTVNNCVGGAPQTCTPGTPTTETCNGIDDDCDAAVDENLGSTSCGTGACSRTVNNCVGGVPQTCTPGTPTAETCNGIDDDCDAAVDENLGSTSCGTGACSRTVNNCVGGVPQTCSPGTPTPETCNGIDDDCDGAIDDNLGTITCGVGACTRTASSCVGGVPQNCTPGSPTTETCNGIDDDCDGATDESLGSTTCGTGACSRTVNNCVGGVPQTCSPGTPTPETCNGIDDDCDAAVDENLGSTTCGTGACSRTVTNCVGGVPQTCAPGTPTAETCNGIDDDCDAAIDENFDVDGDGVTTCAGDCNDLVAAIRPGAPEICNGTDDNCNLAVDEGFPDGDTDGSADCVDPDDDNDLVPDPADCAPLVNSVSAVPGEVGPTLKPVAGGPPGAFTWTRIAQANVYNVYRSMWNHVTGAWSDTLACLVPESTGNGFSDSENPLRGSAFFYVITATNRCGEGTAGTASNGQPRPIPVSCTPQLRDTDIDSVRDIDDDCPLLANASQLDRDHDGRGDACDNCLDTQNPGQDDVDLNGLGDACQDADHDGYSALVDCNDTDPAVHPDATETCNARDDDCDGVVDDNLGITTCGVGACSRTVNNCAGGVPQTCTPGTPTAETCNALDDDCDGSTDEGFGTTTCGVGACARTVNNCSGGQVQQCVPGTPAAEVCNGLDDDCDGVTDESFLDTDGDGLADCADPDDDGDGVPDLSDNCPLIANAGQQNLDGDGQGDACDSDQDGDTFNNSGSGAPIQTLATSEQRLEGTQTGTLSSVQSSDGLYEAIKEVRINNISVLDMRWTFSVPAGHLAMVFVEAHQSANAEGDNYQFSWSTDGTNFTNGVIVKKTADDNLPQYFALPLLTSGTITIRVRDTNRTTGTVLDTVFVDQIRIITSDPADCNDRAASVNPSVNEGPPGAGTCSDLVDNNCDGRVDNIDANCR